jgi:hypothetical protein
MIVTEDEAKTKRCQEGYPASDGVTDGDSLYNQKTVPALSSVSAFGGMGFATVATSMTAPMHCIGSSCMAWRWYIDLDRMTVRDVNYTNRNGYCGKAGKP